MQKTPAEILRTMVWQLENIPEARLEIDWTNQFIGIIKPCEEQLGWLVISELTPE